MVAISYGAAGASMNRIKSLDIPKHFNLVCLSALFVSSYPFLFYVREE